MGLGAVAAGFELAQHLGEEDLGVAVDADVGLEGGFDQFGCVDVDLDAGGEAGERLPVVAGLADVETGAEDEQDVGVLHGEVAGALADGAGASAEELVVGGDEVVGPGGDDGDAEAADDLFELGRVRRRDGRRCRRR